MIKAYLVSTLVYTLILYALPHLCMNKMIKNGWVTRGKPAPHYIQWCNAFLIATMPVVRVFVVCGLIFLDIIPHEKEQDDNETY